MDKKLRRENWPAIETVLRHDRSLLLDKNNKANTRRYYIDGVMSEFQGVNGSRPLRVIERLLLEPDATKDKWAEWYEEVPTHDSTKYFEYQGGRKNSIGHYFGNNSLFGGREEEIYDFFYKDNLHKENLDKPLHFLLSAGGSILNNASRMKLNSYNQNWRLSNRRFDQIMEMPAAVFSKFNGNSDCQLLAKSMCMTEWAHRNILEFDSNLIPMIKSCRKFYIHSNQGIKVAYEQTLENKLDLWVESTGAGGRMSICIRYDEPQYLDAILPFLHPETRYPCEAGDQTGLVRALPLLTGRNFRTSYNLMLRFWNAGFVVKKREILDERTLYLELLIPLGRKLLYPVLSYLSRDATNFKEKISARKNMAGDDISDNDSQVGQLIYVVEPCIGKRRVGAIPRYVENESNSVGRLQRWIELTEGVDTKIDKIIEHNTDRESVSLLLEQYDRILGLGIKPMQSEKGCSIDGFENVT